MRTEEMKIAGKNNAGQRLYAVIDAEGKTLVQIWATDGGINRMMKDILDVTI